MSNTLPIIFFLSMAISLSASKISLTTEQQKIIGMSIWRNECAQSTTKLTFWNQKEPFPSFGIGHFIWFPQNYNGPYTQTFPDLLRFLTQHDIDLPEWLKNARACPWETRDSFMADFEGTRLTALRTLLANTIELQTQFIIQQLEQALPTMLSAAPRSKYAHIKKQFYRLASSENGMYALIDYCNFKGWGTNPREQYDGHGWGLRHVLQAMDARAQDPVAEFTLCAKKILAERAEYAPADKPEKPFILGWNNRLNTYLKPLS
jgi:hypothetical protein